MAVKTTSLYCSTTTVGAYHILVLTNMAFSISYLSSPSAPLVCVQAFYHKTIDFIIHSSIFHCVVHSKSYSARWAWIVSIFPLVLVHTLLTEDITTAN